MKFLDNQHEQRFLELIVTDNANLSDSERLALFYVIGNFSLRRNKELK